MLILITQKKLKYKRLDILKKNKNFFFYRKDINAYHIF